MYRFKVLAQCVVGSSMFILASGAAAAVPELKGSIRIDGSSTVYPITEAVAEEFQKTYPDTSVTVGISGTGGGMKKFIAGEIDIADASRPIKATEMEQCEKAGVAYVELPVAYDALSIVVNKKNTWVDKITVAELKKMWEPAAQGKIMKWSDVRSTWPDKPLKLYGAGVDSGTFDYFTEAIVGKEDASRGDYTSSEDDNVIVQGVTGDEGALGFFGVAYYEANKETLKAVPVDDEKAENGAGGLMPTKENVIAGTYAPLSRPLFIYAKKDALERPEVREFVSYYLKNAKSMTDEVGYITLPDPVYALASERFEKRMVGSLYGGTGHKVGMTLEELLKKGKQG